MGWGRKGGGGKSKDCWSAIKPLLSKIGEEKDLGGFLYVLLYENDKIMFKNFQ